jgi:hypothetical protein
MRIQEISKLEKGGLRSPSEWNVMWLVATFVGHSVLFVQRGEARDERLPAASCSQGVPASPRPKLTSTGDATSDFDEMMQEIFDYNTGKAIKSLAVTLREQGGGELGKRVVTSGAA